MKEITLKDMVCNSYNKYNGINARDIYDFVKPKKDFSTWFNAKKRSLKIKITEYDLVNYGNTNKKDYILSLGAAHRLISGLRAKENVKNPALEFLMENATNDSSVLEPNIENDNVDDTYLLLDTISINSNKDFGNVATIKTSDGKVMFKANDILSALGYSRGSWRTTLNRKCKNVIQVLLDNPLYSDTECNAPSSATNFISQGDMYRLIMSSKLPSAEKFEAWIMEDVIPSVMNNGFYATTDKINEFLNDPDMAIKILEKYKEERQQKEALKVQIESNRYKIEEFDTFICGDGCYSISSAAKMLSIPLTPHSKMVVGRNTLMSMLRRDRILISKGKNRNTPFQKYVNNNWFKIVVDYEHNPSSTNVYITPVGLDGLYKKYRFESMPKEVNDSNNEQLMLM